MERITRFRVWLLMGIVAVILSIFSIKLYAMQVVDADVNGDNVTTYTIRTRVRGTRGDILDINGNKLVTSRASYDLHLNHFVILNATGTNARLLELVQLCRDMGLSYTDHFPVTAEKPFTYTLDQQNNTWKGYYQKFLVNRGNVDSDITAPLLIQQLRSSYRIPEEWSDEDARAVIGLRYELTLRNITNLPTYVLLEDASEAVVSLEDENVADARLIRGDCRRHTCRAAADDYKLCHSVTSLVLPEVTYEDLPNFVISS